MKYRHPFLCYDVVFKTLFSTHPNLLARLISDITNLSYDLLENNIYLEANELPIERDNEKFKRCDFIVKYNKNSVINIEINQHSYTGLIIKNISYVCNLFSTRFSKGETYDDNIQVIQININAFKDTNTRPLTKYYFKEDESNKIYIENINIYALNVVKCYEVYYNNHNNKEDKYIDWGALIYSKTLEEIEEISKNILDEKERMSLMEEINKISSSDWFMTAEESIRLAEWEKKQILNDIRKEGLEQGRTEGLEQGIEQGIEQNTIKTVLSLLNKNMSLEDISDITGKTVEEIKEISKNN